MPGNWTKIRVKRKHVIAVAVMLLCCILLPTHAKAETCILYDANTPLYVQYASELQKQQPLREITEAELNNETPGKCELIVTLGFNTAAKMTEHPGAVIHALITRSQHDFLYQQKSQYPRGRIYLDRSLEHYFGLIQTALSERKNIIFLVSDNTRHLLHEMDSLSREIDKKLITIEYDRNIKPGKLLSGIKGSDSILLITPDSDVMNSETARSLILTAYQQGIAMVAYSQGLVKSGALMSIHSSLSDMVIENSEMIERWVEEGDIPESGIPINFSVAINYNLARALSLRLPSESLIKQEIIKVLSND